MGIFRPGILTELNLKRLDLHLYAAAIVATAFANVAAAEGADAVAAAPAPEGAAAADGADLQTIVVLGRKTSYSSNEATASMLEQETTISSVLNVIDRLPGVLVTQGDTFGSDDWSTVITMRGFQSGPDGQQLGTTIDGIPNGNSGYGGGSKANRYIDPENLAGVEVSQGTADIASRSNEALGGTLNFRTRDPLSERALRVSYTTGDDDAQKLFMRYDTGDLGHDTFAWVSYSHSSNADWVDGSGGTTHSNMEGKIKSRLGQVDVTGYASWDNVWETNYNTVSIDEFHQNPDWDRLTGNWTGVPYIDQQYRQGWGTLRDNYLGYLKFAYDASDWSVQATPYYHQMQGRGDWLPPYVVDVASDSGSNSELDGSSTVRGGSALGQLFFVNPDGTAATVDSSCTSSITWPYGGASNVYDPACYDSSAIPVGSYRHTHYEKKRVGLTADANWEHSFGEVTNTLRGGLWLENQERPEWRDWHKVIDSEVGMDYYSTPYWVQYDHKYTTDTTMYYVEDTVDLGPVSLRAGGKQFLVDVDGKDRISGDKIAKVNSDSDLLFSGGLVYRAPINGLEAFAGYAQNFSAIKDDVIEANTDLDRVKPETADNIDAGLRYSSGRVSGSLTYYDIKFDNRIVYISAETASGIDYLGESDGSYLNYGGMEANGLEAALSVRLSRSWSVYGSYTHNDSTYSGTGDPELDEALGISVGKTVAGSVEDQGALTLDYSEERYFGGVSTKWVGERWIDQANTGRMPSYWEHNLYAGVRGDALGSVFKHYELRLTVNNLTDSHYLGGVSSGTAYIGAPRTAALNISADF